MNENDVCNIVAGALGRKEGSVSIDDGVDSIEEWDSLGFLSILSALEKKFGGKVADIDELAAVKSVREIVNLFKEKGII